MKKNILLSAFLLLSASLFAQDVRPSGGFPAEPQSSRIASYNIDAKLDVAAKVITATETLTWRNTTNDTIRELMFHTYLNAFKNSQSTYFLERNKPFTDTVPSSDWDISTFSVWLPKMERCSCPTFIMFNLTT